MTPCKDMWNVLSKENGLSGALYTFPPKYFHFFSETFFWGRPQSQCAVTDDLKASTLYGLGKHTTCSATSPSAFLFWCFLLEIVTHSNVILLMLKNINGAFSLFYHWDFLFWMAQFLIVNSVENVRKWKWIYCFCFHLILQHINSKSRN